MKFYKRGLAMLLAALLMVPALPASAEEPPVISSGSDEDLQQNEDPSSGDDQNSVEDENLDDDQNSVEDENPEEDQNPEENQNSDEDANSNEDGNPEENPNLGEDQNPVEDKSQNPGNNENSDENQNPAGVLEQKENLKQEKEVPEEPEEEIFFNTGDCTYSVVSQKDFEYGFGDVYFDEDGNYTINIPETNPFFPYEVQFTYEGEVTREWFMTPDDSVEVGGHTFYVSAYFDGTAVTQMNLNVAGDIVTVYPEEKEFTEGDGATPLSLLPLEEKYLTVDLTSYTPAELTMVSVDSIFAGETVLSADEKVAWTYHGEDDYTVSQSGDRIDLSHGTTDSSTNWEMIVGDGDQLTGTNIRYNISFSITPSREWLVPSVYSQTADGSRAEVPLTEFYYADYYEDKDNREMWIQASEDNVPQGAQTYVGLRINPNVFSSPKYSSLRIYEGKYGSAAEAMAGTEITGQIWEPSMSQTGAGYALDRYEDAWVTIVTFDSAGQPTGYLPFSLYLYLEDNEIGYSFYAMDDGQKDYGITDISRRQQDGENYRHTMNLYKEYTANGTYYLELDYRQAGENSNSLVTAAYVGMYASVEEAQAAGAVDIKETLFNSDYNRTGYTADFSQGVQFTIFVGQEVYYEWFQTVTGENSRYQPSSDTYVTFEGLVDAEGNTVGCKVIDTDEDSYAEFNYLTILAESSADLTNLAPVFRMNEDKIHLYAPGSSSPEISGESYHDFSGGAVQYTAAAEDGTSLRNYWLRIVKPAEGRTELYINSLSDPESEPRNENGVSYSTREIVLDGYHNYWHDILLANIGTAEASNLSAELSSDNLVLDSYWTLSGENGLSGFDDTDMTNLANLAKVRLRAADGAAAGENISGTLTIKSGSTVLMVLTLTGTIGDPTIVTTEIPQAVKYVPYGTMIQNNNKYSWNQVSYYLAGGDLPGGMEIKSNGEIYGVPTESGEFTFTVCMYSRTGEFEESEMTYTLIVQENTDANVEAATDIGYELTQRIQNLGLNSGTDQTLVSQGEYAEFVDIFLDGVKLQEGVDYTSESGSTRITIRSQTLKASNTVGTHTLGIEFRTADTDTLKRAAQNYEVTRGSGSSGGSGGSSGSSETETAGTGAAASGDVQILGPSSATQYTIQPGDTLWGIAVRYYGSGQYWQNIFLDNANVISDPNRIFVGQVITLNPIQVNTGAAVSEGGTVYTIQSGDSLWRIAEEFYGRGWNWRRIYQANRDVITNPRNIYAGQTIVIPE